MIDRYLAEIAFCRAVAFVVLPLAGFIGLAALWGKPILALFCFAWGRLIPDLSGRDWATVVLAASAAAVTFTILSAPGLALFLREIIH